MWIESIRRPVIWVALLAVLPVPDVRAFDTNHAAIATPATDRAADTASRPTVTAGETRTPLPTLDELQGWRPALRGPVENPEPALRERAVRETGLQVGSQTALARISRDQNATVETVAAWLDEIYRFDQLLMEKGLVLPPIVIEARRHAEVDGAGSPRSSSPTK